MHAERSFSLLAGAQSAVTNGAGSGRVAARYSQPSFRYGKEAFPMAR